MAFFSDLTANRWQVTTYLIGVALFSISFLVFINSTVSFVITERIGQHQNVGNAVGTLGFADELVALVACPLWGILSDRVGVRMIAVVGYTIVGLSLMIFVQAENVYPQLLLARMFFSLGGSATATMVTATLPSMTYIASYSTSLDSPALSLSNGNRHNVTPSISSELTITPARFLSQSPPIQPSLSKSKDAASSSSYIAGFVGMFTGLGALVALAIFLPLPTRFEKIGAAPAAAVADSFYVVGSIAIFVAVICYFGLRNLPGEDGKSLANLFHPATSKSSESVQTTKQKAHSYFRLLASAVILSLQDSNIFLGYLGGFVARASSVAISLFIPLFTNAYFIAIGRCSRDENDSNDIKHTCRDAYLLAAALTGTSQLVALLCAPLYGYIMARARRSDRVDMNFPTISAGLAGIAGYGSFAMLKSPETHASGDGKGGGPAVFFIAALLGISQIGAIVCSLGLLSRGIQNSQSTRPPSPHTENRLSTDERPGSAPLGDGGSEAAPLLPNATTAAPLTESRAHLKGSIAGTYSLFGGAGILLLTKLGGFLFDKVAVGAPFWMMAAFNLILLIGVLGVSVGQYIAGSGREQQPRTEILG